jgi:pimeloyl-ACP methyl ester carboxylesterase
MAPLKRCVRWLGRGLSVGAVVALAAAVVGWTWERSEQRAFIESALDPPGEMIRIGAQDLHVIAQGSGSVGVLLVSGAGDNLTTWDPIRGRLAELMRVVSYDRPGLGWSPPREAALTVDAAVQDIRGLLLDAELFERAPILVGHSLGGLIARQVAYEYPSLVSGLILLDSPPPQGLPAPVAAVSSVWYRLNAWYGAVGLGRWRYYRANPQLAEEQRLRAGHLNASGSLSRETRREFLGLMSSAPAPHAVSGLGSMPLTVVVAPVLAPPGFAGAAAELYAAKQLMAQESERGRLVKVTTKHYVHSEDPDAVIGEIYEMLSMISASRLSSGGPRSRITRR